MLHYSFSFNYTIFTFCLTNLWYWLFWHSVWQWSTISANGNLILGVIIIINIPMVWPATAPTDLSIPGWSDLGTRFQMASSKQITNTENRTHHDTTIVGSNATAACFNGMSSATSECMFCYSSDTNPTHRK